MKYIWGFRARQHLRSLAPVMNDDNDGQMIFGELVGLKLPDICLTGEEKRQKNLTQETCPDRWSNPGPLRDRRACYHLLHDNNDNDGDGDSGDDDYDDYEIMLVVVAMTMMMTKPRNNTYLCIV